MLRNPAIQIVDSESQYDLVNYPIIANQRSVSFSYFIIHLAAECSTYGLLNERLLFYHHTKKVTDNKLLGKFLFEDERESLRIKINKRKYKKKMLAINYNYEKDVNNFKYKSISHLLKKVKIPTKPKQRQEVYDIFKQTMEDYSSFIKRKYQIFSFNRYHIKKQQKLYKEKSHKPRGFYFKKKTELKIIIKKRLKWLKQLKEKKIYFRNRGNKKNILLFKSRLTTNLNFDIPRIYLKIRNKTSKTLTLNYYKILEMVLYKQFIKAQRAFNEIQKRIHKKKKNRIYLYKKRRTKKQYITKGRLFTWFRRIIKKYNKLYLKMLTLKEIFYYKKEKKLRYLTSFKLKKEEISSRAIVRIAQYYKVDFINLRALPSRYNIQGIEDWEFLQWHHIKHFPHVDSSILKSKFFSIKKKKNFVI